MYENMRAPVALLALLLMGCQVVPTPEAPQGETVVQAETVARLYVLVPTLDSRETTGPDTAVVLGRAASRADTAILQPRNSTVGDGTLRPESVGVWEGGKFRLWVAFIGKSVTGTCTIRLTDSSGHPLMDNSPEGDPMPVQVATATLEGHFGITPYIYTVDDLEMLDSRTITARLESCDLPEDYPYRIGSQRTATINVYEWVTDLSELIAIGSLDPTLNLTVQPYGHQSIVAEWVSLYASGYTVRFNGEIVPGAWTTSSHFPADVDSWQYIATGLRPDTRYCFTITGYPIPNHKIQGAPTEDVDATACARTDHMPVDPDSSNACSRFAAAVRRDGDAWYSGQCHQKKDWKYWTFDATTKGRPAIGVTAASSYAIVCGHNGEGGQILRLSRVAVPIRANDGVLPIRTATIDEEMLRSRMGRVRPHRRGYLPAPRLITTPATPRLPGRWVPAGTGR